MKTEGMAFQKSIPTALAGIFAALFAIATAKADTSVPIVGLRVGVDFTASTLGVNSGFIPPDTMGAVSETHIVQLINGRYSVYQKSDGTLLRTSSLDEFWTDAGATIRGYSFDPRILWDNSSGRWFAAAVDNADGANDILVAVSKSADPTVGWNAFAIDTDPDDLLWADFPTLGMNADEVLVSANMFSISNSSAFATLLLVIPKSDLLAAAPNVLHSTLISRNLIDNDTPGFSVQPVVDLGNSGLPLVLISAEISGFKRSAITGTITAPILDTTGGIIAANLFGPPPQATQPIIPSGGPAKADINTGDLRLSSNLIMRNGIIWGVQTVDQAGRSALRWFKIDVGSNSLLEEGLIADPELAFYYASVAVNARGDVVIGFSGSGASEPVSIYAVAGHTSPEKTVFGEPLLVHAGVDDYEILDGDADEEGGRNRWGDYSATVVDPVDQDSFWLFQEFVSADDTWSTRVTQVTLGTRVAVLGAETDRNNADVKGKLASSGLFTGPQINVFGVAGSGRIPTTTELRQYNAVLVYSNYRFTDPATVGDVLAQYLESGGGVVVATHGFSSDGISGLDGSIVDSGYLPFGTGGPLFSSHLKLAKDLPDHDILASVSNFDGGFESTRDAVSVVPGAALIAHWSDGTPMIATREAGGGRIVGLNFWPPSNDSDFYGWQSSSDGGLLMANALLWAARKTGTNGPYPSIVAQPQSATANIGETATFSVSAIGEEPLTYFWVRDGVVVTNGAGTSLSVGPVQLTDSGSQFSVIVSNAFGVASSAVATLTVTTPCGPIVTINFDDVIAPAGFPDATHLTDHYQAQGVTFAGPSALDGGAILNNGANFRITGYSGHNFLAFNFDGRFSDGGMANGPESISFASPMALVRLRAGTGLDPGQNLTVTAYDATNSLLASASIILSRQMTPVQLVADGIRKVVVSTPSPTLALDDLTFVPFCSTPPPGQPQIVAATLRRLTSGQFEFAVTGSIGSNYEIQVSTDLRNWELMSPLSMTNNPIWCADTNINLPWRFYRARLAQ